MKEKQPKPSPGPTPLYGEPMKRIITLMPQHMIDWIDSNPGTRADVIRGIIQKAMDKDKKDSQK